MNLVDFLTERGFPVHESQTSKYFLTSVLLYSRRISPHSELIQLLNIRLGGQWSPMLGNGPHLSCGTFCLDVLSKRMSNV